MKEILDRLSKEELVRLLERNIKNQSTIPCISKKPLFSLSNRTDR